ncbi:TVP38/TMEM64 family protein [Clostridium botulinum]|uniref:TVP38/TMEM64 family membrane protein n=1 Tax=Clostridium botulinum TaxID=1491 RepID=A0ABD7CHA6_CLOBO|nr:TVP38/TMEM64 family protein [Clostridium botulinum]KGO14421.1 membrane protein [Clostridium botulinum]KIN83202.1 membrane protein [Clostridium botulinum]MCC5427355.1 TVP38/TMEM64 family protein [Clostridium botulinum]QRI52520.1 TVP38/TMEM64 family protein [Clostridium botulinum]
MDQKKKKSLIIKLGFLLGIILLYFLVPGFKNGVNKIASMLARLNIEEVKDYIKSFGVWAPLISMALMMFQSIAAPLPAFIITFANAWVFGWAFGALMSWTGAMMGAALCFYISKFYGRPVAEKIIGKKALDMTDKFFDKYGKYAILIARLLPFVSFDAISYAAGLTEISFWAFFWATGVGQLPATIVYSILGQNIGNMAKMGLWIFSGVVALIVFAIAIKKYLMDKKNKEDKAKVNNENLQVTKK